MQDAARELPCHVARCRWMETLLLVLVRPGLCWFVLVRSGSCWFVLVRADVISAETCTMQNGVLPALCTYGFYFSPKFSSTLGWRCNPQRCTRKSQPKINAEFSSMFQSHLAPMFAIAPKLVSQNLTEIAARWLSLTLESPSCVPTCKKKTINTCAGLNVKQLMLSNLRNESGDFGRFGLPSHA